MVSIEFGPGVTLVAASTRGSPARAMPDRLIDVSRPIHSAMEIYPGDPGVSVERVLSIAAGDPANVSRLAFGVHTGTHVDAEVHFVEGTPGVEALPLDALLGPAVVIDARDVAGELDAPKLASLAIPHDAERLLLATAVGARLGADAARLLVDRGVRLVGIDQLSIGGPEAHRSLLASGVVILEGLELSAASPGRYTLVCLRLLVPGADGAPARAVLAPESSSGS